MTGIFSTFSGLLFKSHFFHILTTQILNQSTEQEGHRGRDRDRDREQFPSLPSSFHLEMESLHLFVLLAILKKKFYGIRSEFSRIVTFSV